MTPTVSLSYECPACKKTFAATITVPHDPGELVAERERARLRALRVTPQQPAGQLDMVTPDLDADPVVQTERDLLESMGVEELEYATCPGCGQRNPVGVAHVRTERRASRAGVAGFFTLVALAAFFAPWVAYVVPVLAMLILVVGIHAFRRSGLPVPIARLLLQAAVPLALSFVAVRSPRWAFVVPLVFGVLSLVQRSSADDERFARAAERIRFHESPYRAPGR